ncbi:hypothetical protein CK220_13435 [Mesorhizobium sp. WSM3860]|nr:hypothetical protein CK220_13435 [Mesorhizobium sp. WSM3860]
MRQHMLNGWLVAALLALTCLLGITVYAEVKKEVQRTAWIHGLGAEQRQGTTWAICS